ncbi:MAG: right-handed parallel beta-helix repeat-containing protein [Chthoniobacterales bacterium]
MPAGHYTIGSTWQTRRSRLTIQGAGIGKTILVRDTQFNGIMVRLDGAFSIIRGLTVDGNGTATAILLNRPGDMADAIEVKNFTHIGIAVAASGCRVTNCLIRGLGDPAAHSMGIWHDAGPHPTDSTVMIDHNIIDDNGINGIYCTGGQITIAENRLNGNHRATVPSGGGQIDVGNAFTSNTFATITGNRVLDGGGMKTSGIELGGGNFTISNNTIRNHGLAGIAVGHNATRAIIKGNTVSNSGRNVLDLNRPQCRSGIYVMSGAARVEISGDRCFDDQASKTQTWGVLLVSPPSKPDPRFSSKATEHVIVKDNDLRGNVFSNGLLDQSMAVDKIISANVPAGANP